MVWFCFCFVFVIAITSWHDRNNAATPKQTRKISGQQQQQQQRQHRGQRQPPSGKKCVWKLAFTAGMHDTSSSPRIFFRKKKVTKTRFYQIYQLPTYMHLTFSAGRGVEAREDGLFSPSRPPKPIQICDRCRKPYSRCCVVEYSR